MDTWTYKKFSNRKFSTKSEFTWLVIDGFMEENGLAHPPEKNISSPQYKQIFVVRGGGGIYHGK